MTTPLNGLLGGVIVGLAAALAVHFGSRLAPAPEGAEGSIWHRVLGDRFGGRRWARVDSLAVYGGILGTLLLAVELFVLGVLGVPPTWFEALAVAGLWSLGAFAVLAVSLRVALGSALGGRALGGLLAYHAVYGLGLGAWLRLTWIT